MSVFIVISLVFTPLNFNRMLCTIKVKAIWIGIAGRRNTQKKYTLPTAAHNTGLKIASTLSAIRGDQ